MLTKEDFALILRCTLFQGFTERSLSEVLNWLGAFECSYRSGEMVFLIGDPMRYAGILLKGTVSVSFLDESSNSVNMNLFFPGELFGESLACLEGNSPVQMKATSDCRILFLNLSAVTKAEAFPEGYQAVFVTNLLRDFARQNRFINRKLRIVSQKRLRDRSLSAGAGDAAGRHRPASIQPRRMGAVYGRQPQRTRPRALPHGGGWHFEAGRQADSLAGSFCTSPLNDSMRNR